MLVDTKREQITSNRKETDGLSNITNHRDSWKVLKGFWALTQAGGSSVHSSVEMNLILCGYKIITSCIFNSKGSISQRGRQKYTAHTISYSTDVHHILFVWCILFIIQPTNDARPVVSNCGYLLYNNLTRNKIGSVQILCVVLCMYIILIWFSYGTAVIQLMTRLSLSDFHLFWHKVQHIRADRHLTYAACISAAERRYEEEKLHSFQKVAGVDRYEASKKQRLTKGKNEAIAKWMLQILLS